MIINYSLSHTTFDTTTNITTQYWNYFIDNPKDLAVKFNSFQGTEAQLIAFITVKSNQPPTATAVNIGS